MNYRCFNNDYKKIYLLHHFKWIIYVETLDICNINKVWYKKKTFVVLQVQCMDWKENKIFKVVLLHQIKYADTSRSNRQYANHRFSADLCFILI